MNQNVLTLHYNKKIRKIISDKLVWNISHLPFSIQNLQGLLNPPPRLSSRLSSRLKFFMIMVMMIVILFIMMVVMIVNLFMMVAMLIVNLLHDNGESSRLSSRLKLFALKPPPLLSSLHLSLCDLHKCNIA